MQNKLLLFFHKFDPINENILNILDHASVEMNIQRILLVYDNPLDEANVFSQKEKIILINASTENRNVCQYIIYGDSFSKKKSYFLDKLIDIRNSHQKEEIVWLLTSKQYKHFKDSEDFKLATSLVDIAIYMFNEDKEELNNMWNLKVTHINKLEGIETVDDNIYQLSKNSFVPIVVEYINASIECAIKRIKYMEEKPRFEHSMRVASTIAKMCELTKEKDEDFKYKCYIAAIYHDICKNLPWEEQISIAKEKLNIVSYKHPKILHGPVGKWYLENKYYYKDQDVLEAITQHTIPSKNPSKLTKFLYLADKLELDKKDDFEEQEFAGYWKMISENKINDVFEKLTNKFGVDENAIVYSK